MRTRFYVFHNIEPDWKTEKDKTIMIALMHAVGYEEHSNPVCVSSSPFIITSLLYQYVNCRQTLLSMFQPAILAPSCDCIVSMIYYCQHEGVADHTVPWNGNPSNIHRDILLKSAELLEPRSTLMVQENEKMGMFQNLRFLLCFWLCLYVSSGLCSCCVWL